MGFVFSIMVRGLSIKIMEETIRAEYIRLSSFLGMEGGALSIDVARLSDIINQGYKKNILTEEVHILPLIYCYLIGRGKLDGKYLGVLDKYMVDLMVLIDDYTQFTYNLALFDK